MPTPEPSKTGPSVRPLQQGQAASSLQKRASGTPNAAAQTERIYRAATGDEQRMPPNPNQPPPLWVFVLAGLALILAAVGVAYWMRRRALRAWEAFAARIGGEFKARNRFAPAYVSGTFGSYPFFMEMATSHEDDAPYYHTRAAVPVKNPAGLIMGLRHKSLLEEVQTRGEATLSNLGDTEFARRFFLVCNAPELLPGILSQDARRTLSRYSDVEIYLRFDTIEWRRAGEQSDLQTIQQLCTLLVGMADAIDQLPRRTLSLSQRMADEELIVKGV